MLLVENVHCRTWTFKVGALLGPIDNPAYLADIHDGIVTVVERTDPKISFADIIHHGKEVRRRRMAASPKRRTIARSRKAK